jgi:predicted molibdopterin-dependent oxidoreductase YjgC
VNDAWICDRGRFVHGYVDHLDRLTAPLIRRDGRLERATWDEALDLIVQRLREEIRDAGSSAVAGLGSPRTTNEA